MNAAATARAILLRRSALTTHPRTPLPQPALPDEK